jgi:peptidoglycan/xylan/chitin deacetylase (PgdA/CDA1 family)
MSVARAVAKTVFAAGDLVAPSPPGPRLLIYHQVGTDHGHEMEVDEAHFARQLAWLERDRELVDLETAVSRWEEPGSDRLVVITFDDGYRDVYTTAFPMLRAKRVPFVLYVSTGLVGTSTVDGAFDGDPLSWDQMTEMVETGLVTVGAHTHTHPDLRDVPPSQVEEELERSDAIIEARVGVKPRHFAYPYGFWSESADELVRERYVTAVLGGAPRPPVRPDPHLIHRYPVQKSDGNLFFKARVRRGLRLEEAVRRRIKGYRGP